MANPSSTSSKRLVGLGLRGMRNSVQAPPTQVTAQIKSALAQSNPRTSPTMATVTTTTTPGGLTRTTTTSPSATSMRTSPSMMNITSFTHPNAVQHLGGNTPMTRTPTSPVGLKTVGVRGSATTTSPTMLSRSGTTMTSPFGTPTSTPFVTPNTSPQMGRVNAAGGVEAGKEAAAGSSTTKAELVNASARAMKSPHGHTPDGYFGPMKRLEEIVNEISEEMREGGGSSPHSEPPLSPEFPMFFDVPFPLHPDKTFRIHSSPTTVNEWVTKANSDAIPQRPLVPSGRVVSNAADNGVGSSMRSPAEESDRISVNARSDEFLERFINSPHRPSSPAKHKKLRFSPLPSPSCSPRHHLPISSPRSSPGSRYSRMSADSAMDLRHRSFSTSSPLEAERVSSPPASPSSSLSRWLREENGHHNNYSMICSASESPLLGSEGGRRVRVRGGGGEAVSASTSLQDGLESCSSVGSSLSSRKRSGFNSPVAKIETVLGPRERGIGCIPEKRDYHSLYSRLRSPSMSAGSLTPLEENESMDFGFGDADEGVDLSHQFDNSPAPSPILSSPSPSPSLPASQIPGMPVITSSDNTVVVANAAVGILSGAGAGSGAGSGGPAVTATAPAPRLGLRRKSTGVGSPLVNVVATYDSIKSEQDKVEGGGREVEGKNKEGEEEDGLDCYGGGGGGDMSMSPVLMRTKDSLLLKDMQRQKSRRDVMEKPDCEVSTPDLGRDMDSGELRFLVDREMKTRGLHSRDHGASSEMRASSPPFCSPEAIRAVDLGVERARSPMSPATEVFGPPDTPTIGPCAMTVEGSRPVDEAISPLQLSSPILPSGVCS